MERIRTSLETCRFATMCVILHIVDIIWLLLAVGFLLAFCIYKLQLVLPGDQVFQDLIRYGKTKKQLKRPGCFRLFDVPKRSHSFLVTRNIFTIYTVINTVIINLYYK